MVLRRPSTDCAPAWLPAKRTPQSATIARRMALPRTVFALAAWSFQDTPPIITPRRCKIACLARDGRWLLNRVRGALESALRSQQGRGRVHINCHASVTLPAADLPLRAGLALAAAGGACAAAALAPSFFLPAPF